MLTPCLSCLYRACWHSTLCSCASAMHSIAHTRTHVPLIMGVFVVCVHSSTTYVLTCHTYGIPPSPASVMSPLATYLHIYVTQVCMYIHQYVLISTRYMTVLMHSHSYFSSHIPMYVYKGYSYTC